MMHGNSNIKLKYILTHSAPLVAFLPGQNAVKRGKHVKDRPGDYEIVIQHDNSRHDNHAIAQTSKQWAEFLVDGYRSQICILAEG